MPVVHMCKHTHSQNAQSNGASSCKLHITNSWGRVVKHATVTSQRQHHLYLTTWSYQISLKQPQGDIAMCVLLCLCMNPCARVCTLDFYRNCEPVWPYWHAVTSLDSRVCSVTAPTHGCLAGLAALPQAAHPFISIFLTLAHKLSHGVLKLLVQVLFKIFAFPRDGN